MTDQDFARHVDIVIVGSGFSGIGMAIQLRERLPETDFVVMEKADDVGGTWRDNTYPGCACDIPSHLYSLSFALNPDWSHTYSEQPEIQAYLRDCVTRFDLGSRLLFRHEVIDAVWDDDARRWRLETSAGTYTAGVVIWATGPLSEPAVPDLPGIEGFTGTVFHSARWRHDHDLTGRRVAVIGTGASAIQFVPRIAPEVECLSVFQRTPPWVIPRHSKRIGRLAHSLYRRFPLAQKVRRYGLFWGREWFAIGFLRPRLVRVAQGLAMRHLTARIPDAALRARLTPSYTMGCKRVLISDDWYPTLTRDNVDVVTEPIREVRPHGIVTADGVEHPVDTIILGTGFHVTDSRVAGMIRGRHKRLLADAWRETMTAYLGTTVDGFPNLFLLLGPNTGLGHNSVVLMVEAQIRYVVSALTHMRREGIATIEPRADRQHAFVTEVDRRMLPTVWTRGGCRSWYLDAGGRNSTLWPGFVGSFRRRLRRFDPSAYVIGPDPHLGTSTEAGQTTPTRT